MTNNAGDNRFYPSVSPCAFSFFDEGRQANIQPSYLLFPDVRLSDLRLSLRMAVARNKDYFKLIPARQHNIEQGQKTPFGLRQVSFRHMINRFKQPKTQLKDVRYAEQADHKTEGFKAVYVRIMALTAITGRPQTLEENEELRLLRGQLSPTFKANEDKAKEEFKAIWQGIKANGINSESSLSTHDKA